MTTHTRARAWISSGVLLAVCALGVAGCSTSISTPAAGITTSAPAQSGGPSSPVPEGASGSTASASDAPASGYRTASWAREVADVGPRIGQVTVGDLLVEFTQAGTGTASSTLSYTSGEVAIAEGDPLVVLNHVVTNTSDHPVTMGLSLVVVTATYAGWTGLAPMPSSSDLSVYDAVGVHGTALASGTDLSVTEFVLAAGESFSAATNFLYEPGSTLDIAVVYYPAGGSGPSQQARTTAVIS